MSNPPDDPAAKAPLFTLDRATLVPIGLLISVVLSAIAATTWIQGTLLDLDHKIELLNGKLGTLANDMANRWTLRDMAAWAELLQAKNTSLTIPVPKKDY